MFLDQERTWKYDDEDEDEDEDEDHEDDKDEDRCAQCISWQSRSTGQRRRERIRREGKGDPGWRSEPRLREFEGNTKGRRRVKREEGARVESEGEKDRSRDCLTFPIRSHFLTPFRTAVCEEKDCCRKSETDCLFVVVLSCICLFDNVFAGALLFQ